MSKQENTNTQPDTLDPELLAQILSDKNLTERILEEQQKKEGTPSTASRPAVNKEAAWEVAMVLVFFILGIFIASPFLQLVMRIILDIAQPDWTVGASDAVDLMKFYNAYHNMIKNINLAVYVAAAFLYIYWAVRIIAEWKRIHRRIPSMLVKLLPFLVFLLFDAGILLVTYVRGPNEYDLTGHPYMAESIYSYILYPISYFFCGMMVWQSNRKKILLYTLVFTAFPVNLLALLVEYGVPFPYFYKLNGVIAVFHNSNHYGYYLAFVLMVSALLFVYEKKAGLKIFLLVSFCLTTLMLVINNTLGAFLATGFVLTIFFLYRVFDERKQRGKFFKRLGESGSWQSALFMSLLYVALTLSLSIHYKTILDSLIKLFSDSGDIVTNPGAADSAGSGRWRLWKNTVLHIPEHPLVGFGVEGLLNTYQVGTPHNELLQYAANFGIPVTVLYVAANILVLIRVWLTRTKMHPMTMLCFFVGIGYLVNSMFGVAIYYTTPFLFIFLGLAYAEYLRIEKEKSKKEKEKD